MAEAGPWKNIISLTKWRAKSISDPIPARNVVLLKAINKVHPFQFFKLLLNK